MKKHIQRVFATLLSLLLVSLCHEVQLTHQLGETVYAAEIENVKVVATTDSTTDNNQTTSNWEKPVFAHGAGLSQAQIEESARLIGVPEGEVTTLVVTGADLEKYTGRAELDSNMISSVVVQKTEPGSGVSVYINTPENITQIKDYQYRNAAITSGVNDATIVVGAPFPVTGESALSGVYKAFESQGEELDPQATKTANDELILINDISQSNEGKEGFNSEDFSQAFAEIKKQIADLRQNQSTVTQEEITIIINNVLQEFNITITPEQKTQIENWLIEFQNLDIDWNALSSNLSNLLGSLKDEAGEFYQWGQETGFFERLIQAIVNFFNNLFG